MPCSSIFEEFSRFRWVGLLLISAILIPSVLLSTEPVRETTEDPKSLEAREDLRPRMQTEYYPNGSIKSELQVDAFGLPHGFHKKYGPEGHLQAERTYNHGNLHGPSRLYYEDGILKTEWYYRNGQRHGLSIGYYRDGTIKDKGLYQNDLLEGRVILYFRSGKIRAEMNFRNDVLDGASKTYYEGGGIKNLLRYKKGRLLTMETFDREGYQIREQEFPRAHH